MEPQSFIDAYVNPIFNFTFKFNDPEKIREKHTYELAQELNKGIHPLIEKYHLEELGVREDKPGLIKNDIQVNFSGKDGENIAEAMKRVEEKLSAIPNVKNVSNNAQFGKMEYKLRINAYGEQLGLSEVGIAQTLSGYFLDSRKAMTFSQNGVMEIRTKSMDKDSEKTLIGFMIPTPSGSVVKLTDVVEIKKIRAYEKIEKRSSLFLQI